MAVPLLQVYSLCFHESPSAGTMPVPFDSLSNEEFVGKAGGERSWKVKGTR